VQNMLLQMIMRLLFLVTAVPIHRVAKAYASYRLGDPTAKNKGMLTLNPLVHIDPLGALMILFVGFGWGRELPTNPFYYRNRKRDTAIVALAGPAANLALAFAVMLLIRIFTMLQSIFGLLSMEHFIIVLSLLQYLVSLNIWYAVFNLIPVPPLGGFSVLRLFISDKAAYAMMQYQQYIMLGLIIGLYTDILSAPIMAVANLIYGLFSVILNLIPFV